ncbi:MAG: glycosyltransferase [Burkholderiaceae bacterium]
MYTANKNQVDVRITISIITATYNAAALLPTLIDSLRVQTDKDFEWIVADGGSTDGTLALLKNIRDLNIVISSQPDFGIYDALNRAIKLATNEYYIVMGADDSFFPDAIRNFRQAAAHSGAEIVTAEVLIAGQVLKTKEGKCWRFGLNGFISAHSVGTMFRKTLHQKFGFYSRKFPIAADQLFVIQACQGGASRHVVNFISGKFGTSGISTSDYLGTILEFFRVQIITKHNKIFQLVLLWMRLIRNYFRF